MSANCVVPLLPLPSRLISLPLATDDTNGDGDGDDDGSDDVELNANASGNGRILTGTDIDDFDDEEGSDDDDSNDADVAVEAEGARKGPIAVTIPVRFEHDIVTYHDFLTPYCKYAQKGNDSKRGEGGMLYQYTIGKGDPQQMIRISINQQTLY
jgi:hypothetical protein